MKYDNNKGVEILSALDELGYIRLIPGMTINHPYKGLDEEEYHHPVIKAFKDITYRDVSIFNPNLVIYPNSESVAGSLVRLYLNPLPGSSPTIQLDQKYHEMYDLMNWTSGGLGEEIVRVVADSVQHLIAAYGGRIISVTLDDVVMDPRNEIQQTCDDMNHRIEALFDGHDQGFKRYESLMTKYGQEYMTANMLRKWALTLKALVA